MNIATLLSGGVDSAVATHLLCEQGYTPDLFYIKIGMEGVDDLTCTAEEDIELCRVTARKYGLHFDIIDLQKEYWEQVISYVVDKVKAGLTPNPDVMCNRLIKFGCFEQQVGHHYDRTATGHYATIVEDAGKIWLGTAADAVKDQTDFLAQIDYLQVSRLMFPIGKMKKEEVRAVAQKNKLPSALRKDSQGICFLGKINYNDFIKRLLGEKEGSIVDADTGKKLGVHHGYWFHTIGQRKGLGLSGGPYFVVGKNVDENIVFVSKGYTPSKSYSTEFKLRDFHFITDDIWNGNSGVELKFKIRHTDTFCNGTLFRENGLFHVKSQEPIQGVAPGQFGVLYNKEATICVGSGEIA